MSRSGRPGNCEIVNKKHWRAEKSELQHQDEEKLAVLFEMALKIKELEELRDIRTAHERFNKVQNHFEFQNLSNASSGITISGLNGQ